LFVFPPGWQVKTNTNKNGPGQLLIRDKPSLFLHLFSFIHENSIRLFCCYSTTQKINQINNFIWFVLFVFYPDYHRLTSFNIVFSRLDIHRIDVVVHADGKISFSIFVLREGNADESDWRMGSLSTLENKKRKPK